MYLSIGYLMILIIDYPFHLPLEVAGVVLAFCFLSLFTSYSSGKIAEATRKLSEEAVG